jgi:hypothetical protein
MPDMTGPMTCATCGAALERVRYFPRQLITADDMRAEQQFLYEKRRRHNRFLHGWGIVCGCAVLATSTAQNPWLVTVCPGYVVSPQGDEILIPDPVQFDLQLGQLNDPCTVNWPCPPQPVAQGEQGQIIGYLAVRYAECLSRPVRVHPAGCGCDMLDCEYSRIRDSFELKLLWALPPAYADTQAWTEAWRTQIENITPIQKRELALPTPPCLPCEDQPWVVLATITIPAANISHKTPITPQEISEQNRRVLLSTLALQVLAEVIGNV